MATIDAFQGAEGSADAQRRALLAAIAQQGSAGRQAVAESQKAAQAAQAASVQGAAQRAGALGTTAGTGIGAASAGAYRVNGAGIASMLAADSQRQASANDNYMGQVKSAIPVLRTLAESRQADMLKEAKDRQWEEANRRKWDLQDRQKQRDDEALARQWLMEDRAYELEQRKAEQAAASGMGGGLAGLVKRLGGSDLAKPQLQALAQQAIARAKAEGNRGTRPAWGGTADSMERTSDFVGSDASPAYVVERLGRSLGLTPGELTAYLGDRAPGSDDTDEYDEASPETVERVRAKPRYAEEVSEALDSVAEWRESGLTLAEAKARVAAAIRQDPYMQAHPRLRDLVIQDALGG